MLSRSVLQSALVSIGTIINSLLGLGFYVLLGRGLGVSGFGYFSYILGLGLLASEVSDLGFNSAIVRFGSAEKFPAIFSLVSVIRLVSSGILIVIFLALSLLFDKLLIYSAAVAITLIFSFLATQGLIARQKYFWQVVVSVAGNLVRFLLVFYLFTIGFLTPVSSLVAFGLGGGVTFLVGLLVLFSGGLEITGIGKMKEAWQQAKSYVPGVALSFGLASLSAKIDIPVVFALAGPAATGYYSSAQKLASVFQQIAAAIEGVFAPKFARLEDYRRHFTDYLRVVGLVIVGVLVLIPLSSILLPLFFGVGYLAAVGVFQILLVATVLFLASGPFATVVLYKHGLANYHLAVTAVSFIFSLVAYFLLIPRFGVIGAGGVFVVNALVTLLGFIFIWKKLE